MRLTVAAGGGLRTGLLVLSVLLILAGSSQILLAGEIDDDDRGAAAKFSPEAAATFKGRCTACHTYGKGIKVGPDLKGVTERRKRDWLLKFIHGSSGVIKSGDPTATALFAQFKQQRMPDWVDLSEKQINDILHYLAIGGPDFQPADERNASTSTSAENENGRKLFYGEVQTKNGAQACITCHSERGAGLRGGTLGPDLTGVYRRYQDPELTQFLRHTCFDWQTETSRGGYLTAKESFALKAFLRASDMQANQALYSAGNRR
ncbi:MAG: c-type cytochrome [Terracidiphilus sp.]|jgi:mono/diheme cytochrome c family protein